MISLTLEKGLIFRITHIDNVKWILEHGLHCRGSNISDPNFVEIGNQDLIQRRKSRSLLVSPGGTLSDYIPFYFTPYSPMLLNIKTGYNGMKQTPMREIAILVTSLPKLAADGVEFLISDRHAYLTAANFSNNLAGLSSIDWGILQSRDFKRDPQDPGKVERYQAEALVHRHLPVSELSVILCHAPAQQASLQNTVAQEQLQLPVIVRPDCYV